MSYNDENELTTTELELLATLPREKAPSELLEERVVRALRKEGHLGAGVVARKRGFGSAWKVAAAVALFAGGVATGRFVMMPDAPQSASVAAPSTIMARDTMPTNSRSLPVKGEMIVAETELWL